MDILSEISKSVRNGDASNVETLAAEALENGINWTEILAEGLTAGMEVIGELFRQEDIFIPEVLMAAKAMDAGTKVLEPRMKADGGMAAIGKVILGTVKGDLHDLGKKLVKIMLTGAGFDVIDLGVDVLASRFVDTAVSEKAGIIAMSALLTTTMPYMKTVIDTLRKAKAGESIKVIVGGACTNQQFADAIGADAYGENATDAVRRIKELMKTG